MDLRLLDNIVHFMSDNNLTNRYDQFILAGSSLGAELHGHWNQALFDHIAAARELHGIEDVYILEHRDCGAYARFLGEAGTFDDTEESQQRETETHTQYANKLAERIRTWSAAQGYPLRVTCLLMDLRGDVELLKPTA